MRRMYFLPGTGADARLPQLLEPRGVEIITLPWLNPQRNESLPQYAARMAEGIDTSEPFYLLGVSIGGMIAVEIAKLLQPEKTIIISSVKTSDELPPWYGLARGLKLHRIFPARLLRNNPWMIRPFFGTNRKEYELYRRMLADTPPFFLQWAQGAILHWENHTIPPRLVHIHGTKDPVFPIRYIKNCIPIPGGPHFMLALKAREIRKLIWEAVGNENLK